MCWWNSRGSQFVATVKKRRKRVYFSDHVSKDAIDGDGLDDLLIGDGRQVRAHLAVPHTAGIVDNIPVAATLMVLPMVLCALREIIEAEHDPLVPIGRALSPGGCGI